MLPKYTTMTVDTQQKGTGESPSLLAGGDFFINFYKLHGRSFAWRKGSPSPFSILVAEILLKQTRAESVNKVWPHLIRKYSNARELAKADPVDLFDAIAFLGFGNQRTRALIELSSAVASLGKMPSQPEELIRLPHVGEYTAHAVACFAFSQRFPIVDLNVVRVISRVMGFDPPQDIRRAPGFWEIARQMLPLCDFKEHNFGLLDFAAIVCRPRSPLCGKCSIVSRCSYARTKIANVQNRVSARQFTGPRHFPDTENFMVQQTAGAY